MIYSTLMVKLMSKHLSNVSKKCKDIKQKEKMEKWANDMEKSAEEPPINPFWA